MSEALEMVGKVAALVGVCLTLFTVWNNGRQARRQKSVEMIAGYGSADFRIADRYFRSRFAQDYKAGRFDFSRGLFSSVGQTAEVQQLDGTIVEVSVNQMIDVVASYYNKLGILLATGILDKEILLATLGHDAIITWDRLGAVIRRHDVARDDTSVSYMAGFYHLSEQARRSRLKVRRRLSYRREVQPTEVPTP